MRGKTPLVAISLIAIFLAGCGLTTERIPISYRPEGATIRIQGVEKTHVVVRVSDLRKNPPELSKKGDEYEILAPILAENDVAEVLRQAIASELKQAGYTIGPSGAVVDVELNKFYNRFLGGKSVAEIFMHVQVRDQSGGLRFSTIVQGEGVKTGVALRSGENAKYALDAALSDAVRRLMTDIRFTDALLAAGKR